MYLGKRLFVQMMDFLPWKTFHRIVGRYGGDLRHFQNAVRTQIWIAIGVYVLIASSRSNFAGTCPCMRCYRYCR